jgi:hypothetical protein
MFKAGLRRLLCRQDAFETAREVDDAIGLFMRFLGGENILSTVQFGDQGEDALVY